MRFSFSIGWFLGSILILQGVLYLYLPFIFAKWSKVRIDNTRFTTEIVETCASHQGYMNSMLSQANPKKGRPWRGWYFPAVLCHQALPVEESYDRSPEPTGEDSKRLPVGLFFSVCVPENEFPNLHPRNLMVWTWKMMGKDQMSEPFWEQAYF